MLSQKNAVRWGLSLNGAFQKVHKDSITPNKTGNLDVTGTMNYLWYAHLQHRIRFYYGLGPMVSFGYTNNRQRDDSRQMITRSVQTDAGIGIDGIIGVEWFIDEHICLMAEYNSQLNWHHSFHVSRSRNVGDGIYDRSSMTLDYVNLNPNPVRFGISIYF